MRWRLVSIFLLVQQAVWLLVLLPGHQRGAMLVAGWEQPTSASGGGGGCCAAKKPAAAAAKPASCHADTTAPAGDGQPDKDASDRDGSDRAARCAVCHIAVRMTLPPVVDLTPPPLELLEVLPPSRPSERPSLQISPTYLACGPPAA